MAKTKKKTDYQYNYKPTGENVEEIVNWLQHQSDKPFSLNILIQQAMHKYGKTTDLKQLMLNQFINGDLSNGIQSAQAKPNQAPTTNTKQVPNNPTTQPDPNPDSAPEPNLFPQPDPYSKPIVSKVTDPHPTVMLNKDHHDSLPDNTKTISKQSQLPIQNDVEDDSEDDSAPNLAMLSKH